MNDALSERLRSAQEFVRRAKQRRRPSLNAFIVGKTGTVFRSRGGTTQSLPMTFAKNQTRADLF
jgi:hypothetical protein